jgi:hypothetical protein
MRLLEMVTPNEKKKVSSSASSIDTFSEESQNN